MSAAAIAWLPNVRHCSIDSRPLSTSGLAVKPPSFKREAITQHADLCHDLIQAYDLTPHMSVINPPKASREQLLGFHSASYVEALESLCSCSDPEEQRSSAAADQYGLCYDCPVEADTYDAASWICGGTITAARSVAESAAAASIAINWCGGWHHAKREEAAGFCYLNDVVLGILELLQTFERVLYIDLDLHHGDGVEDAFCTTRKVFTLSLHKYASGFFPGTGRLEDVGCGKGKYFACNLPLKDGVRDDLYCASFARVAEAVRGAYSPQAVVCQCGADGLAGDPNVSFNLSSEALRRCIGQVLDWQLPTLLLGGGGYNFENASRCWTRLTALAVGRQLSTDIPEHKYFTRYGPVFELDVEAGNRPDTNKSSDVDRMLTALQNSELNLRATALYYSPVASMLQNLSYTTYCQQHRCDTTVSGRLNGLKNHYDQDDELLQKFNKFLARRA